jgi:hypothetical protein
MLVQQHEASERQTLGLRLIGGLAIVPGVVRQVNYLAGTGSPLGLVADQAGGSSPDTRLHVEWLPLTDGGKLAL